jgi:hypothetical protein
MKKQNNLCYVNCLTFFLNFFTATVAVIPVVVLAVITARTSAVLEVKALLGPPSTTIVSVAAGITWGPGSESVTGVYRSVTKV